jgi:CheY-like chemotaxis protein/HPt (histidine-containing phosphotransfer) domain-containing protein
VVTAAGVKAAQDILSSGQHAFHVAVIDSDMPGQDGFTLADWLGQQATLKTAIIMLLTSIHARRRHDMQKLGIRAALTKPVRPSDLYDTLIVALGLRESTAEDAALPDDISKRAPHRALNILVAEDTPFNQKFILRLLTRWQHKATIVDNGHRAVEAHRSNDYDLILMDVQMPEMDGLEATAAIRAEELDSGQHIPIIAMTAHAMRGDKERCLGAGMDAYVPKPISSQRLRETIHRLMPPAKAPTPSHTPTPESVSTFDPKALLSAFDNDPDFLDEVVGMFLSDYPDMLAQINGAIETLDASALERSAHALKGMLGNFRADHAADMALRLEEMGRNNQLADAQQLCNELSSALDQLEQAFRHMAKEGNP